MWGLGLRTPEDKYGRFGDVGGVSCSVMTEMTQDMRFMIFHDKGFVSLQNFLRRFDSVRRLRILGLKTQVNP